MQTSEANLNYLTSLRYMSTAFRVLVVKSTLPTDHRGMYIQVS